MKVIDLEKLIDSGEIPPKKIKYKNKIYNRTKVILDNEKYWWTYLNGDLTYSLFNLSNSNDEVEIIEDTPKEDKKISHISNDYTYAFDEQIQQDSLKYISDKINEIIDKINGE